MHAQVHAGDADQHGEEHGDQQEVGLEEHTVVRAGEDRSEREIGESGEHGMSAGEAGGGGVNFVRNDVGARAVEGVLEKVADQQAASDGPADEQRHVLLAVERQEQAYGGGEQRQDGRAAEGGDVAGGIQQGGWAEGLKIAGPAQGEKQSAIEFAGAPFHDLVGKRGEEPDACGQASDCEESTQFVAAQPGQCPKQEIALHGIYCAQRWGKYHRPKLAIYWVPRLPMRRQRTQMMNKSILLVDDCLPNLKLTRFLLMEDGFEVRTAENAEQALLALETRVPDMILMDIQMPGMDGLALTRHLRRDGSLGGVPIVAFTASAIKGDEEIARAAGCDGYITKPIDTRTFVSIVREYAGNPSAGAVPNRARCAGSQSRSEASSMLFKQTSSS